MSRKELHSHPRKGSSLHRLDWTTIEESLNGFGYVKIEQVVQAEACRQLTRLYEDDNVFRSRVVMERYNFGVGDYAYFSDPLPKIVADLRTTLYEPLVPLANRMMERMGLTHRYPQTLIQFRTRCRSVGQTKPTPLMLRYEAGGFNCLHRDLYGPTVFPLQAMVMLSQKGKDFEGGEFVLVENRPRQQSRVTVVTPNLGDLVIFPVCDRPVPGKRGVLKASMRHGVSRLHSGQRWALGIIFHDAK